MKAVGFTRILSDRHCETLGGEAISGQSLPRPARPVGIRGEASRWMVGMLKPLMLTFILALLPSNLSAQPEFFGYFESEANTMQLGTNNYSFGFNKFRLDVEARPNDNVLIGANMNIEKFWGTTSWNVYDFIPGFANTGAEFIEEIPDTVLIDNLYMRVAFPWLDLTVGRQQISPGVGYAWNPTDLFNSKSLLDPSYEQTGVSAIRIDIPIANRLAVDAVIQPEDKWQKSTKQLWLKTGFGRFDIDVTMAEIQNPTPYSVLFGDKYEAKRTLVGGSLVGELLEWGVWLEYAQNNLDSLYDLSSSTALPILDKRYDETVLGLDHTFDNSLYLLAEFLHNGFGVKNQSDLGLDDYFYALSGEGTSLMQDYGFLYLMHPTFDYVSLSAIAFANFNDRSGTIAPQLDWNAFEDTNISLQGSFFWGEDNTEFGLQDWGIRLRVHSDF